MLNPAKIEQLAKQVADNLPPGVKHFGDEVDKQVKQVLQSGLSKLDVVAREEFDVQTQVLLRTRQKLQALEARVTALEELLVAKEDDNQPAESAVVAPSAEADDSESTDKAD